MAERGYSGEKNLIRSEAEYNVVEENEGGVDFTSPDGGSRFPYLVNMYRDWECEDGAALETVPGYRSLPKALGEKEPILGLYSHTFTVNGESVAYIAAHKESGLYLFRHEERDLAETLSPVAAPASAASCAISRNGAFYLLDGEKIFCFTSPEEGEVLGDEPYTDEMEELGSFPETNAYIPTLLKDGKEYEDRNLLTDYFDIEETLGELDEIAGDYGLKYRLSVYQEKEVLEVYGLESGRTAVYVPSEAYYLGELRPVVKIAAGAFTGRKITEAVLSDSVKVIGGDAGENNGAFYGCTELTTAVLAGVETVGEDAFALCSSLETLVLPESLTSVASSAFYGTSALKRVCYGGMNWSGTLYNFGSGVEVYPNTAIGRCAVGKTLYLPCDTTAFPKIRRTHNASLDVLTVPEAYEGISVGGGEVSTGYAAKALRPAALVGLCLKSVTDTMPDRYAFYTLTDRELVFTREEEPLGIYRLSLPDTPQAVVFVKLDGENLSYSSRTGDARQHYAVEFGEKEGRTAAVALRLTLPLDEVKGKLLRVRLYGQGGYYDPRSLPDFRAANPSYTKSAAEALGGCRVAAVYDDRIFLSGNPALPGTVFYSVVPKSNKNAPAYFGAHAFLSCGEGSAPITALLSHPNFLAVMKEERGDGGGLFFCTPYQDGGFVDRLYRITDGAAAVGCAGAAANFRDDPVFLSRMGLCGISGQDLKEERAVENRSFSVDRRLLAHRDLSKARLTEWKGYLALLLEGEIFLADSRATYRRNGVTEYEWYYLSDIGHYDGQTRLYRHMSAPCFHNGEPLTSFYADGEPLTLLGREEPVTGEVFSADATDGEGTSAGVTVYYTDLSDNGEIRRCLVDSDGEMTGGRFYPAVSLHSYDDVLYFGTSDGKLFCFNTDKRGEAVWVGEKCFPTARDAIPNKWYTFNGRAYLSGFVTPRSDLTIPHLAKSTVRRSLIVKCKAMPRSRFVLRVRTEKEGWKTVEEVTASSAFDEKDFSNESFVPESRQLHTSREHEKKWVEKQLSFSSNAFRRPFGIYAASYRFRIAGRPKR